MEDKIEKKQEFSYLFKNIGRSSESANNEYSQKINEFFTSTDTNKKKLIAEQKIIFEQAIKFLNAVSKLQGSLKPDGVGRLKKRYEIYSSLLYRQAEESLLVALAVKLTKKNDEEIKTLTTTEDNKRILLQELKSILTEKAYLNTLLNDKEKSWGALLCVSVLGIMTMGAIAALFVIFPPSSLLIPSFFSLCLQATIAAHIYKLLYVAFIKLDYEIFKLQINAVIQKENINQSMNSSAFLLGGVGCLLACAAIAASFFFLPLPLSSLAFYVLAPTLYILGMLLMSSYYSFDSFYALASNRFKPKEPLAYNPIADEKMHIENSKKDVKIIHQNEGCTISINSYGLG